MRLTFGFATGQELCDEHKATYVLDSSNTHNTGTISTAQPMMQATNARAGAEVKADLQPRGVSAFWWQGTRPLLPQGS